MKYSLAVLALATACGGSPRRAAAPAGGTKAAPDPVGPHRAAVAAQVQPLIDDEIVSSLVVGLYDGGKLEIYGFGKGPHGAPPDGRTLFELGPVTRVYTAALLADAVQRREVALDTPLSELLPPGVTAPTRDGAVITLRELALHSSGLPPIPPTIAERANANANVDQVYADYGEDALYADLVRTQLLDAPGKEIVPSTYGIGVLGFVLGKKAGGGYARALETRVLAPLGLTDTYVATGALPPAAKARLAPGMTADLQPVPPARWGALAGAGGVVSNVRDQLHLLDAELDAAAGGKRPELRALRLAQEPQLQGEGKNASLGWQIDDTGRYWESGGTRGFRCFVEIDPKNHRGFVILAATSNTVVDELGVKIADLLDGKSPAPQVLPNASQLAPLAGTYDLSGTKLQVTVEGKRLYLDGQGTKVRLVPYSDHEFWIEDLHSVAVFERDGDKIARIVFEVGGKQLTAARVP